MQTSQYNKVNQHRPLCGKILKLLLQLDKSIPLISLSVRIPTFTAPMLSSLATSTAIVIQVGFKSLPKPYQHPVTRLITHGQYV